MARRRSLDMGLTALSRGLYGLSGSSFSFKDIRDPLRIRFDDDLIKSEMGLGVRSELRGVAELDALVGAQTFADVEASLTRGATAMAFGALKGRGLEGSAEGFFRAGAGPETFAGFGLRYAGRLEELDVSAGGLVEAGRYARKAKEEGEGGEEHVLVEGVRAQRHVAARIAGLSIADIEVGTGGVRGRVETLGKELELRAFDVLREARVAEEREIAAREARYFVGLRARFEDERSRLAATLE